MIVILTIYVNDTILSNDNLLELERIWRGYLLKNLKLKILVNWDTFNMEFARFWSDFFVSQWKCTLDLLKEIKMLGYKPTNTPSDPNRKLGQKELSSSVDKGHCQPLVGNWYAYHTCPDIAFIINIVSQFMHSSIDECFEVMHQDLKYLKESPRKGLLFETKGLIHIKAYIDAN